ncbi:MAG TPA: TetR/AcrR family transcriptional regulator, partial [Mycobacteriales bacterium]|nr:TetR/AcrR family transcriptional regulator [Mycobacteriales bacterium]
MTRASYHHGDLRRALLDEAHAELSRHGEGGLSVRDLARRVGVSPSAPLRHFPSRDHLLDALAAEGFAALTARLRATAPPGDGTAAERLAALATAYVAFAVSRPELYRLMTGRPKQSWAATGLAVAAEEAFAVLTGELAAGQRSGELVAADVEELAVGIWAQAHGLARLVTDGALDPDDPVRLAGDV